jgi:hypothetical protein
MKSSLFDSFASWEAVLTYIDEGKTLYYHARLGLLPVRVSVIERFKNGKLRIKAASHSAFCGFTIDKGHLDRLSFIK